jgi:hypothetical protein
MKMYHNRGMMLWESLEVHADLRGLP